MDIAGTGLAWSLFFLWYFPSFLTVAMLLETNAFPITRIGYFYVLFDRIRDTNIDAFTLHIGNNASIMYRWKEAALYILA